MKASPRRRRKKNTNLFFLSSVRVCDSRRSAVSNVKVGNKLFLYLYRRLSSLNVRTRRYAQQQQQQRRRHLMWQPTCAWDVDTRGWKEGWCNKCDSSSSISLLAPCVRRRTKTKAAEQSSSFITPVVAQYCISVISISISSCAPRTRNTETFELDTRSRRSHHRRCLLQTLPSSSSFSFSSCYHEKLSAAAAAEKGEGTDGRGIGGGGMGTRPK